MNENLEQFIVHEDYITVNLLTLLSLYSDNIIIKPNSIPKT